MLIRTIIFLFINFTALAIGGYFSGIGVPSDWYSNLAKAPWTPPGFVFGVAWTTIMILFSFYMAQLWPLTENKIRLVSLFSIQWILNVSWNPTFFYFHQVLAGLFIIVSLCGLIGFWLFSYWPKMKLKSLLLVPYFLWLLIAASLNGYIFLYN